MAEGARRGDQKSFGPATPHGERFAVQLSPSILGMEVLVVLSLSLLPSAVDSLFSLLSAPLDGVSVAVFANVQLVQQVVDIMFGLAPVALVFYLIERNGEQRRQFGLDGSTLRLDAARGTVIALLVSAVGLGVYLGALALKINRFVVPVPPLHHWWTIPVLALGAAQAGLLEEVIVTAYLIRRLEQIGWAGAAAVAASSLLRAAYHLYQGWGGFTGNLLLGVFFGTLFVRFRRTWPLVIAHGLVDLLSGLGYIAFRGHCPFGVCIR